MTVDERFRGGLEPHPLITGRQAYHLDVPVVRSADGLSVVSFRAVERFGEPYQVTVQATHDADLDASEYLNREAAFVIDAGDGSVPRRFAGWISSFSRTRQTRDFCAYEIVVEPVVSRLRLTQRTRVYQNTSAPKLIETILRQHDLAGHQFALRLRRSYPVHAFRLQYQMSDWDYIRLLMEQEGMYCFFAPGEHAEMIVFGDDIDHYLYKPELRVPYRETSGLESGREAVFSIKTHARTVQQSFMAADYNADAAWDRLRDVCTLTGGDRTTYGQSYIYGTHHKNQADARWEAQLRHEAALVEQLVYEGESNVVDLRPARILRTDIALPNAPHGQAVIEVNHVGARNQAYRNTYRAIPSLTRYRLPIDPSKWPRIAGTLSGRVSTSVENSPYAYLTQDGHYRVRFDFDFDAWPAGGESVPLRLAKPFAGGMETGFHFPLLPGTEVAIAFHDGNPNRPYIAHALHNSVKPDHVTSQHAWHSRNVIRTQSNNKLRMEDWKGGESIKLSTDYCSKSQLNLGYLVDATREKRGEGFELRTSGWGALRAGKGIFISADDQPNAQGKQLDMIPALRLLNQAQQQAESLAEAASAAQALMADCARQRALLDDTLTELRSAGLLVSAPAGVAVVSGKDLQLSAGGHVIATAGGNADISVWKQFMVAAGHGVSMFAQRLGMKLFAAQGKVEIQAQNDEMSLAALKDLTVASVNGRLVLTAEKEVLIGAGGSYIRITPERIENGTDGDILDRCAAWDRTGPASMQLASKLESGLPGERLAWNTATSPASGSFVPFGMPYTLVADGVPISKGTVDSSGLVRISHQAATQAYRAELVNGAAFAIPIADRYLGDEENGEFANRGYHFYESGSHEATSPDDRAIHRKRYSRLQNPESES